jgi:hypothetical protein
MAGPLIEFGLVGLPQGVKPTPRADFKPDEFTKLIELHGPRFAWSRAAKCPCATLNDQTRQPDPNCTSCTNGWRYFGPRNYAAPLAAGQFTDLQKGIMAKDGAAVIRGVMTGVSVDPTSFDRFGPWMFGNVMITVRPQNKLGYYDRLVDLDSTITWSEIVDVDAGAVELKTRFPMVDVNYVASEDARFELGADFELTPTGSILWFPTKAPSAPTRFTVHYAHHPQWLVLEHPKTIRQTTIGFKTPTPTTPVGNPVDLPIMGFARLEFLVNT